MSALAQHLFFAFPSKKRGLSGFSLTRDGDEGDGDGGGGREAVAELEKKAGTEEEIPIG